MSPLAVGLVGIAALVLLILIRIPVAVALGLVGFVGYAAIDGWTKASFMIGGVPIEFASMYTLSVVPLFTLMGAVAASAGLSADLFRASRILFRGVRGSLSIASIFASALFGAVCGSSVATALTMSKVSIPEMLRAGYPPQLAAGAVAAGGTLGILIPPSLILMIYAIIAQQSVAKLFMAALIPGLILTVLYCTTAIIYHRALTGATPRQAVEEKTEPLLTATLRIWHVIALFTLTLGGIYLGWFTPTEAAAIGAFGALALSAILRRHSIGESIGCFTETVRLVSSLVFIVIASAIFSYFIVQTGVSNHLIGSVKAVGFGPIGIVVAVCLLYIVMGAFLEGIGMLLVTVPITLPLVLSFGYNPIWFGVLLVILIEIGLIHPPMGMNLFAINAVTKDITIFDIYKGSAPFLIAPIVLIALMIAYPQLVMWLPSQLN
jgi:tripartite ATP-independent transporter DctM subunit